MPNERVYAPLVIDVPSHYDDDTIVVEGQTFTCMAPGQTAIVARWPYAASIAKVSIVIYRCFFEPGTHEWANLVHLVNAWNPVIDTIGNVSGPTGMLQNGIILDGCTMDAKISKAHISHPITGVLVAGESEGPTIHDSRVLGGIFGVVANTVQGEAGMVVSDSHFAVSHAGIVAVNRPQATYHDLLIYRHPWRADPAASFTGLYLGPGSDDSDVHDVKVKSFGSPCVPVGVNGAVGVQQANIRMI